MKKKGNQHYPEHYVLLLLLKLVKKNLFFRQDNQFYKKAISILYTLIRKIAFSSYYK